MRMLVLGAGLQGSACAYDLLQNPEVTPGPARRPAPRPPARLPRSRYSGPRLIPTHARRARPRGRARRDARVRRRDERHPVLLQSRSWPSARSRRACTSAISAATPRSCSSRRSSHERGAGEGHHRRARLRPGAGHGEHPRRSTASAARHGGLGAHLRRRTAAASRAAAQLPDRLLARGRARLLHDAVVGAARRQARRR